MTSILRNTLMISSAVFGMMACDAKDALDDASGDVLGGDPQTSYCEAVCEWAVGCTGDDSMLDSCLEDTRAADSNCAAAESGDINPASSTLLEDCVTSVSSDSCDGLNGSIDAQTTATPSTACVTSEGDAAIETYNAARTAVQSSGEQFCTDLGSSICANVVDCLVGDFGVEEAEDALQEACESTAISALVTTCNDVDLEPSYGTDPNVNRMAANSCSDAVGGLSDSCAVFSADAWPADCAAVVVDASALPGLVENLVSFATEQGVDVTQ